MMGPGSTIAFAALMICLISVAGILLDGYKSRMKVRERELELRIAEANAKTGPSAQENERIEERLRVLERIATDKSTSLAAQIEDLRQPAK